MQIIRGNILEADTDFIVHQCNCVSSAAMYLAKSIFEKYPHADIYADNTYRTAGTIIIRSPVINLIGQIYPGTPRYPEGKDGYAARLIFFKNALNDIQNNVHGSIAFPYGIGCGAAGGYWPDYLAAITDFSFRYKYSVSILRFGEKNIISDEKQSVLW